MKTHLTSLWVLAAAAPLALGACHRQNLKVNETKPLAIAVPSPTPSESDLVRFGPAATPTPELPALALERVHFAFDRSDLSDQARTILKSDAAEILRKPDAVLAVEGHCDERGSTQYNLALGQRRADAVRTYLITLGVPGSRLNAVSYGEEKPLDPGHNEAAWAKNRRAELVVTGTMPTIPTS